MRYTVNEKEKYLSIHEADVPIKELVKLLSKYDGYKVQVNIRVPENSYQMITDAGFPNWTSSEPTDPYKITCEKDEIVNDPCVCGKNKNKK